jgi:plastocyanin
MQVTRLAFAVVVSALFGCGGGGGVDDGGTTGPPPPPPPPTVTLGSITTSVSSLNLVAGNSQTITVSAFDPSGAVISNAPNATFTSASNAVAEVDNQGTVIGLTGGATTINVSMTIGSITKTAAIPVTVTGALPNDVGVVASSGDYVFTPKSLAIQRGGNVTWTFGGLEHTVIFNQATGAPAGIDGTGYNTAVSRTFNTAGNFSYYCRIHAGMSGQVIVR